MPAITSGRVSTRCSLQPSRSRPAEVVGGQVETLDVRAERAVEDDDALVDGVEERLRHGIGIQATEGVRGA